MNQFTRIKAELGNYINLYFNKSISRPSITVAKEVINSAETIRRFKSLYIKEESIKENYPKTFDVLKKKHGYSQSLLYLFCLNISKYSNSDLASTEEYIEALEYFNTIRWAKKLSSKKFFEEEEVEQPEIDDFSEVAIKRKKAFAQVLPDVKSINSLVKRYTLAVVSIYFGHDIENATFEYLKKLWRENSLPEIRTDIMSFYKTINEDKKETPKAVEHFLKHPSLFYSDVAWGRFTWGIIKFNFYEWERYFTIKDTIPQAAIELLCNGSMPKDDDFSNEANGKRGILLQYFENRTKHFCKKFEPLVCKSTFKKKVDHVRAILDSYKYGNGVTFVDSFTYSEFYDLAITCEKNNTSFDKVREFIETNSDAIKEWNKSRGSDAVIYTNNYSQVATSDHGIMQFIENYNRTKAQREELERRRKEAERIQKEQEEKRERLNKARQVLNTYRRETQKLCPSLHADLTDSDASLILSKESQIIELANFNRRIASATSSWNSVAGIPLYYFYHYYPTKFSDVTSFSNQVRTTIWNFKDGYSTARNAVVNIVCQKLRATFSSSDLQKMTFVCIPASTRITNNTRYKEFAKEVCSQLNMRNAFDYITITKEKTASHLGGTDAAEYSFSTSFFREANVILFDDVVTRGHSMSLFKNSLENMGANVIFAMSIGRTYSDYYGDHRTPHPWTGTM